MESIGWYRLFETSRLENLRGPVLIIQTMMKVFNLMDMIFLAKQIKVECDKFGHGNQVRVSGIWGRGDRSRPGEIF